MAATAILYQTDITLEKNALVENIGQYLGTCPKKILSDVQYFKHDLETSIKLSDTDLGTGVTQDVVDNLATYNYIAIDNTVTSKVFYYFITGTEWISEKAVKLNLRMDTINSMQDDIVGHFTNKTKIIRQHKDRFHKKVNPISADNKQLMKIVDRKSEGINPPLRLIGTSNALDQNHRWVLMYVQADDAMSLTAQTYVYAIPRDTSMVSVGGTLVYLGGLDCIDRAGTEVIKLIELPYEPFGVSSFDGVLASVPEGWELAHVTADDKGFLVACSALRLVLMTNGHASNLQKIFETYLGSSTLPGTVVTLPYDSQLYLSHVSKSISYESKLMHSDFYNFKFIYDNFGKEIRYEDLSYAGTHNPTDSVSEKTFLVTFYPSNNVSSKLMFKIEPNVATEYKRMTDYEDYLVSGRNLELVKINSDYLNYIRNGYNYDTKAHDIQTTASLINFGVGSTKNAISAFTSGVEGNYGKMASSFGSMITDTTNMISKELLYENSMQAKLANLAAQGAGVAGTDDLSLLETYNGNKLLVSQYWCTSEMLVHLFNLFYYCGYRVDEYGVPDITSRRLFNFIQCTPVFNTEKKVYMAKYLADIKARFEAGVTVFHRTCLKYGETEGSISWNLTYPDYENWETWIVPKTVDIS